MKRMSMYLISYLVFFPSLGQQCTHERFFNFSVFTNVLKDIEKENAVIAQMSTRPGDYSLYPLKRPAHGVRIMTYNVQRGPGGISGLYTTLVNKGRWHYQKHMIADMINRLKPDIIGFQELGKKEQNELQSLIPGYLWFGISADGSEQAAHTALFYNVQTVHVINRGTFWLNPTGEKYQPGWGAGSARTCTWGKFVVKETEKVFYVYNTHLDHRSAEAKVEGARLIARTMQEHADIPSFMIGDFNMTQPFFLSAEFGLRDCRTGANHAYYPLYGTYLNWDSVPELNSSLPFLDWIYSSNYENRDVLNFAIVLRADKKRASDHFPIFADVPL